LPGVLARGAGQVRSASPGLGRETGTLPDRSLGAEEFLHCVLPFGLLWEEEGGGRVARASWKETRVGASGALHLRPFFRRAWRRARWKDCVRVTTEGLEIALGGEGWGRGPEGQPPARCTAGPGAGSLASWEGGGARLRATWTGPESCLSMKCS